MQNFGMISLLKDCDLKFSSKVVTDVLHALASDSDFMYLFRGTYPGAKGKTIGSRTDTNLRGAIGEGKTSGGLRNENPSNPNKNTKDL